MDLIEAIKRGQFNINGFQNPSNEQPQNENTNLINAIKTGNFRFPKIEPPQPTFDDIQNNYNQSLGTLNQARFDYQQGLNKSFANNNVSFEGKDILKPFKPTGPITTNTPTQRFNPAPQFNVEGYHKALEEMQPQQEVVNQKLNDYKYNEFLKNQAEIEQEDTSFYDKTLGTLVRGGKDLFSGFEDRSYITPEGQTTYLPTRNELKQQKVSQDYDTKLGKMLGDTAYNVAKIGVSNVLDKATGGIGGKALYWGDMFTDNLKNAVNEGYDKESAILYSTIGSATEFLTGKFLGSATKGLTGGKTSEVSQLISKVTNKLIKNDAVSNLIGNMGSEGLEEFTQEYIDNFNKLITLEKSKNPKDYLNVIKDKQVLEDAMYSAAVGALSGGLTNVGEFATDIRKPQINPVLEQNNLNNTITPQAQETSPGSLKTSALDYNIDTNNETITSIDRMMSERGINSRFDDKLFDNNNINAFWRTNEDGTREVIFNPNANTEDMLENTAVHELYHDLVNQEGKGFLQDLILSMDSTKQDSLQAREMLKQEYAKVYDVSNPDFDNMVNEEATAIILGKKLGNQEFINELTTTNKGVARKIYDAVVSMLNKLNKLTGYKFEKLYWTDVKNKFENAYSKSSNVENKVDSRYSLSEEERTQKLNDLKEQISKISRFDSSRAEERANLRQQIDMLEDNFEGTIEEYDNFKEQQKLEKERKNKEQEERNNLIASYSKKAERYNVKNESYNNIAPVKKGYKRLYRGLESEINPEYDKNIMDNMNGYESWTDNYDLAKAYGKNVYYIDIPVNKINGKDIMDKEGNRSLAYYNDKPVGIKGKSGKEYLIYSNHQDFSKYDRTKIDDAKTNTRYSKGITSYQDYVNKNYKSTGTGNKLKDIRKPKEKPKEKIALVEVAKPMAKSGEKVAKPVKETPKKAVKTEPVKKEIVRLTAEQEQELNVLKELDKAFGIEGEDLKRYNELKAIEDKSIIHKDLIGKTSFDKVKKEYGKYKNSMETFNDKQLKKSEDTISGNKQGRRTKEQWLDVAEHLGSNIKDMDTKDLEKYAIQSFIYAQPNHKENLNRQGQKYVSFGINEWLERVYKGAGVGEKYSIDTTTRDIPKETKELTPKTTSDEIFESVKPGNKESKFFENVTEKSKFLTEDNRKKLSNEDIKYYQSVTNEESMNQAKERLDKGGVAEINRWLVNDNKGASDSIDVAEGWILLKRAQDNGDYDTMVSVAKKMKEMGTKSGQAIQMYNLMSRFTPEGMVKYATSELNEAWKAASKNKSKDWVDKYVNDFELTPEETRFIVDTMKKVETMEDGRPKQVELGKIQKMLSDKLPPKKGTALKSWMRISMLFNPKTQVRNVLGNAVIMPVNTLADATASLVDKQIAKKTGIRTTGLDKAKNIVKGAKKGAFESYEDFKLGINTRDMQGNKFEVGEGKAFNEKHEGLLAKPRNELSKGLNKVDSILNFVMDAGDRVFYEGIFTNSINNQLELNNTKEVTQDMIDIATQEALAKTWNDNNEYTKFVLNIRGMMNKLHVKGYGIGDVLIPFAKTPANLTKAIVDYSPVGLVKSLTSDAVKLKNNIATGTITAQQQHEFVQNLGKGFAGSLLYILGYGLAKAGVTSGANDDDKDVSDFMRNTLGIQPYSIKIGDKSFTYDWAQPVAAPFGFTADAVKNKKENASLTETLTSVLDTGFNMLLEQSFLSGIKDVLGSRGSKVEGIFNQILGLPARAVPTFIKQINDMIDPNVRMSYEKNKPIESAKNQVKAKIPGQSQDLAPRRDTLGREVKKFGGDNNVFNVFLNPANVSKGKPSLAGKEIYEVYQQTKDKRIMPRYPASVLNLTNKEQSEFLKISGQIIEDNVQELNSNNYYRNLSYEDKAEAIKGIVDFAYNKAKARVTKSEISNVYKKANRLYESGEPLYDYYAERVYNKK